MPRQEMSNWLREAVLRRGLSVNRLAKMAGIPQQVLQRFVAGTRDNLRLDTAQKLMSVLGLTIIDPQPIQSKLASIAARIEHWERIKREYGVGFPKGIDEVIKEFHELHRILLTMVWDDVR
ncbi:MAG: helix-turn-helix domain-containing protein [Thermoguttaceae bacterium]